MKNILSLNYKIIIILVIILIILLAMFINKLNKKAERVKEKYQEESKVIQEEEYELAKMQGSTTAESFKEYCLQKIYGDKIKIGDFVNVKFTKVSKWTAPTKMGAFRTLNYDSIYNKVKLLEGEQYKTDTTLKWRILGANSRGQVELISATPTKEKLGIYGKLGYINAETILNEFCNELYGNENSISEARSINIDDINNFTTFNPSEYEEIDELTREMTNPYGRVWKYRYNDEKDTNNSMGIESLAPGRDVWNIDKEKENLVILNEDGTEELINKQNIEEKAVTHTEYLYNIPDNIKNKRKEISDMLINGTGKNVEEGVWLASRAVSCNYAYVGFYMRGMRDGYVDTWSLYDSEANESEHALKVRPIITLKVNTKIVQCNGINNENNPHTIQYNK